MAVKKVGDKYFPVGKKGKTWKTGFPTEAKAKKALTKANAYWKSKGSGKKKTAKKKTGSKKKTTKKKSSNKEGSGKTTKKRSWVGWARLGVYVLAAGSAAISAVSENGLSGRALHVIGHRYTATNDDGRFSKEQGIKTYAPLAAVATVDTIASKAGVYKRMGAL